MRGHRPSTPPGRSGPAGPVRLAVVLVAGVGLGAAAAVYGGAGGHTSAPRGSADRVGLAAAVGEETLTPQGLSILGNSCANSDQAAHTGFQDGGRCVATEFGEVGTEDRNPTLLISRAPRRVRVGESFTIKVSTRNLVRDRFLGAKAGGYYLESSYLNLAGLQRGHFHTACRMLTSRRSAPDPAPVPAFFKATEDGGGGEAPDTVSVTVTGLPETGMAQCAVWAGDGSHRIPMMQRANQVPAFDVVRIEVRRARPGATPSASATSSTAPSDQPSAAPSDQPTDPATTDPAASDPPPADAAAPGPDGTPTTEPTDNGTQGTP
jgi:hypothetical protein